MTQGEKVGRAVPCPPHGRSVTLVPVSPCPTAGMRLRQHLPLGKRKDRKQERFGQDEQDLQDSEQSQKGEFRFFDVSCGYRRFEAARSSAVCSRLNPWLYGVRRLAAALFLAIRNRSQSGSKLPHSKMAVLFSPLCDKNGILTHKNRPETRSRRFSMFVTLVDICFYSTARPIASDCTLEGFSQCFKVFHRILLIV